LLLTRRSIVLFVVDSSSPDGLLISPISRWDAYEDGLRTNVDRIKFQVVVPS